MGKNKKSSFDKEFSEAIDRMLAGEKIEPYADMPDDYREAIDFAQKLIELKGVPRPSFEAQLKDSLLSKLSEMERKRTKGKRFWEMLRYLIPQRPLWRAVAASLVVVIVAGGVIWGTGILTPPSAPPPCPGPNRFPELQIEIVVAKSEYMPGEKVKIEVWFRNISSQPFTIKSFPPAVQISQCRINSQSKKRDYKVIWSSSAGSAEQVLKPEKMLKHTVIWKQEDLNGEKVTPGWYFVGLEPVQTDVRYSKPLERFLIQYPQGAIEETIEVNKSQTVNGVTITLKRVELSSQAVKFWIYSEPPEYAGFEITPSGEPGPFNEPDWMPLGVWGHYQLDDGPIWDACLSTSGEPYICAFGTKSVKCILDEQLAPIPKGTKELTFIITEYFKWQGPWEFHILLQ